MPKIIKKQPQQPLNQAQPPQPNLPDLIYRPGCPHCPKDFLNNGRLKTHIATFHTGNVRNKEPCSICGKLFASEKTLAAHLLRHTTLCKRSDLAELPFYNEASIADV